MKQARSSGRPHAATLNSSSDPVSVSRKKFTLNIHIPRFVLVPVRKRLSLKEAGLGGRVRIPRDLLSNTARAATEVTVQAALS